MAALPAVRPRRRPRGGRWTQSTEPNRGNARSSCSARAASGGTFERDFSQAIAADVHFDAASHRARIGLRGEDVKVVTFTR